MQDRTKVMKGAGGFLVMGVILWLTVVLAPLGIICMIIAALMFLVGLTMPKDTIVK